MSNRRHLNVQLNQRELSIATDGDDSARLKHFQQGYQEPLGVFPALRECDTG